MTYLGNHTNAVQKGLNLGVGLFIVSEAFFFLAIFWAFFHSAISPSVELGAQWPPLGIQAVNPFELPLLNTVLLLSSGVTITYAHHSLIQSNRKGALYGTVATIILAVIFTFFQGVEYTVSSFTISDSVYGSCFYFGTGFHGLNDVAPYAYIILETIGIYNIDNKNKLSSEGTNPQEGILITIPSYRDKEANSYFLHKEFLEWFVGFTDAEGNFNIKITGLTESTFKNVQFTFQIGLHKDDEPVLNYIMNTLKCGHISKSKDRINYFVNDRNSLLHVILPLFDYENLNSSKYHQYEVFQKAVTLIKDKSHLTDKGKLEIINCKKEMDSMSSQWIASSINSNIKITKFWLAGFIDGEGSFSTNKYVPRFKLENHIRELELYKKINEFLNVGNIRLTSQRTDRENSNPTIVLEVNKIKELKERLIPLMYDNNTIILKSLKSNDFSLWINLIDIYYKGYHTIPEGKYVFDAIKLHINRYRITTNASLLENMQLISISEIENLLSKLYLIDSPYEIKEGIRHYRNTNKLVSEATSIVVTDSSGNSTIHYSMSECAKNLNIGRSKIKQCLSSGESYKGYKFVLS